MSHYDARKALHDPNPPPRPEAPRRPSITLDIEGIAMRAAAALHRRPRDEWPMLERVYVERLLDHLEGRHEPAEIDAAAERFIETLRVRLGRG